MTRRHSWQQYHIVVLLAEHLAESHGYAYAEIAHLTLAQLRSLHNQSHS